MTEKEKEYKEELFKLMQENPDLPVVPMVDYDVCADTYGYWLGSWGKAKLDAYIATKETVLFKSDDDVFEALEECLSYDELAELPDDEEGCRPYYEALPWKKAIVVYIELPEEEHNGKFN